MAPHNAGSITEIGNPGKNECPLEVNAVVFLIDLRRCTHSNSTHPQREGYALPAAGSTLV